MWHVNRWVCGVFFGVIAMGSLQAQEGATVPPAEAVEAAPAEPVPPVTLGPEVDGQYITLERLSRAAEEKAAELRVAKLDEELRKARAPSGDEGVGTSSEPILIGVYAGSQARVAEFSIGRTIRRVSAGGWVAEGVRVVEIADRSVVVSSTSGTRRLFLNREVGSAATAAPTEMQGIQP